MKNTQEYMVSTWKKQLTIEIILRQGSPKWTLAAAERKICIHHAHRQSLAALSPCCGCLLVTAVCTHIPSPGTEPELA